MLKILVELVIIVEIGGTATGTVALRSSVRMVLYTQGFYKNVSNSVELKFPTRRDTVSREYRLISGKLMFTRSTTH